MTLEQIINNHEILLALIGTLRNELIDNIRPLLAAKGCTVVYMDSQHVVIGRPTRTFTACTIRIDNQSIVVDANLSPWRVSINDPTSIEKYVQYTSNLCLNRFATIAGTSWWQEPTYTEANSQVRRSI